MNIVLYKCRYLMTDKKYNDLLGKLDVLETKQAFQEDTIESLNAVIIKQQKDIELLGLRIQVIQERIKQAAEGNVDYQQEEPPPPHY